MITIPSTTADYIRAAAIDAVIALARQFGINDDTWVPEVTTGNGVSTPVVPSDGATFTAYLYQERPTNSYAAAAGAHVGDAPWVLVVPTGGVSIGQTVRSVASSRRVRLVAARPDYLPTYVVEAL
jgi:hypothetical protein